MSFKVGDTIGFNNFGKREIMFISINLTSVKNGFDFNLIKNKGHY